MPIPLLPPLDHYATQIIRDGDTIPPERKARLDRLTDYLRKTEAPRLTFICTHNSRRSQIAQVWATVAAAYYGIELEAYSGGTEVTAFNPRAVAALERTGFRVEPTGDAANPRYQITYAEGLPPLECWSKSYDDPANPDRDFAALMTCSEADAGCPFIPGAAFRLPLTYADPKEADGTDQEMERYDERVREIGGEVFYAVGGGGAQVQAE
jgi:arsenate reductase